jgi:hypothetical protein
MPEASTPPVRGGNAASTPPNSPPSTGAAAQDKNPAGGASTFDLARYKKAQVEGTPTNPSRARPPREKIKFSDLDGLSGFTASDPFFGHDTKFGDWAGVNLTAPDGAKAMAISNLEQGPGQAVLRAYNGGVFDNHRAVPIRVHTERGIVDAEGVKHDDWTKVVVRFG